MNKIILIGNLTRDPEIQQTTGGTDVCKFSIAVQRTFKNQQGEREADFINIVVWRKLAGLCGQYLSKGKKVAVIGRLEIRTYDDNEGNRKYFTSVVADEVEFLTPKNQQDDGRGHMPNDNSYQPPKNNDFMDLNDSEEIIPF